MAELEKLRVKALGLLNNCRDNIASKEASAAIRSQMVGILGDLKKYQGRKIFVERDYGTNPNVYYRIYERRIKEIKI